MQPLEVVERAIAQLDELQQAPGGYADIGEGRVQVWALFDRAVHARLRAADPAFARFGRNGDKSVTGRRAQALLGRDGLAAAHVRRLVDRCASGTCSAADGHGPSCPPLERDPSTDVWRLLEALQIVGAG